VPNFFCLCRIIVNDGSTIPCQSRLLSQEEAARAIGVKPPTMAAWRHQGRGPRYLKVGRSCFYRQADIDTWLDTQCVVPKSESAA
jgi:predicted DNA-binding transcriptional regulator AlpA